MSSVRGQSSYYLGVVSFSSPATVLLVRGQSSYYLGVVLSYSLLMQLSSKSDNSVILVLCYCFYMQQLADWQHNSLIQWFSDMCPVTDLWNSGVGLPAMLCQNGLQLKLYYQVYRQSSYPLRLQVTCFILYLCNYPLGLRTAYPCPSSCNLNSYLDIFLLP